MKSYKEGPEWGQIYVKAEVAPPWSDNLTEEKLRGTINANGTRHFHGEFSSLQVLSCEHPLTARL
jgi:hypothetical protein